MPAYDSDLFSPPAPVATVGLRNPDNGRSVNDVPMLIDSGADVTLIPSIYLEEIGADALSETYELQGFDGQRSFANAVRIDVAFLNRTFRGRFLITNSELGILGAML